MSTPQTIVGHTLQREQLQSDIASGNVAHAYLFSGPAHVGKHTLALQFASQLLLLGVEDSERETVQHSIDTLTHPDLLVLDALWMADTQDDWNMIAQYSNVAQGHRAKKKVKTDVIGIDEVRALQERLYETGTGRYRCCIITSVERMHAEAANAFLKLLEEPPEGVVFLLTTQAQSSLLPTIVSRSRSVSFRRVAQKDMRTLLAGVPEDDAAFILHIARGAPGMAVLLTRDPEYLRFHKTLHERAQSFWHMQSLARRMDILEPLHTRSQEAEHLLLHLGLALRSQGVSLKPEHAKAFTQLVRALETNAHRQLLSQRFACQVSCTA